MSALPFDKLDVDDVILKLTTEEKVTLLSGLDMWHTAPVPRLGIPSLRMSDGPNGVRGTRFFEGVRSSCFPSATGLSASWDVDLLRRVGEAIGVESKAKGSHILLGPTINIQRSPLGGRGFESYSEDPFLSGTLARAFVEGLQGEGVAATVKHFVANDQEFERMSISSEVAPRALREIYLRAFELVLRAPNPPWAVMTCYNRVNGLHASESPWLLGTVLRSEWGWRGMIMSDWFGTYSADQSVRAGLDLEMPGPAVARGAALSRSLTAQKVFSHDLDARVRNILELVNRVQPSGVPENAEEGLVDTPELRALLREAAAASVVLLKNDHQLLPLSPSNDKSKSIKSIAVIGPDAKVPVISGGGSASLAPSYTVTPFDAIEEVAREVLGLKPEDIKYSRGGNAHKWAPLFGPELRRKDGQLGVDCTWYNEDPLKHPDAKPVLLSTSSTTVMFLHDGLDLSTGLAQDCWAEFTGTYIPETTSKYEFGLASCGLADMYIDGMKIIDNSTNPIPGELFFGSGSLEEIGIVDLQGGRPYQLLVRYQYISQAGQNAVFSSNYRGGVRFGVAPKKAVEEFISEAVTVAKSVDVVLLFVGLNGDFESEGYDRSNMTLPGASDELASAVIQANKNTTVVVQSGTPVEMPWASKAPTILQAFYGGNAVGYGAADVIFGKVNPSSRLPLTFPVRLEDNPSYLNFGGENGKVHYGKKQLAEQTSKIAALTDELKLRAFLSDTGITKRLENRPYSHSAQAKGKDVSFYTTFKYSEATLSTNKVKANEELQVSVTITNTGKLAGRETTQFYVHDVKSTLQRPPKELKAFAKTKLLVPGASETVKVSLDHTSLGYFDDHVDVNKWVAEEGAFKVYIGPTSKEVPIELEFQLSQTYAWI